ncbi:MAG: thymidine phosphorylase [Rhodothermales bacterium]|nr:thymidine phosphorylase [Rhodothermales bacterium]
MDVNPVQLILAKRNGQALSSPDLWQLVQAYTAGDVPDYQMSAFLMAAYFQGMDERETAALTDAMLYSGVVLDLSDIPGKKVDKHSTGGVGDKVSLILAPLVAACGVPVPMISGRGLGHSGGTLDKLESIPGFSTSLSLDAYRHQLADLGVVMIGQTADIAPADRKLYALRDVTGTVDFTPFIASSIMSKKLAEGIDALVLDVKCGRGAFMQSEADARRLAETLTGIGERHGKPTVSWLTRMDVPLGLAVGNWPEVAESIRCLRGDDGGALMALTCTLAGEMLHLGEVAGSPEDGAEMARQAIASGAALDRFVRLIEAQGGDASVVDRPDYRYPGAPAIVVSAPPDWQGYVNDVDALAFGQAAVALGAGRLRKEDRVDPAAGLVLHAPPGAPIVPGEPLLTLFTHREAQVDAVRQHLLGAFTIGPAPVTSPKLLMDRYAGGSWASTR